MKILFQTQKCFLFPPFFFWSILSADMLVTSSAKVLEKKNSLILSFFRKYLNFCHPFQESVCMQGIESLVWPKINYTLLFEEQLEYRQHQMCIACVRAACISNNAQEF